MTGATPYGLICGAGAALLIAAAIYPPVPASARVLCIDGHPAPRPADVTYGGLPPRPGAERDHCGPLGLGGDDEASNIWYQPWPEARRKDEVERQMIEAYCRGEMSLDAARARFIGHCRPGEW